MKLKLGISIYSIPNQSFDILVDFAEKNRFEVIEIWESTIISNKYSLHRYLEKKDRELSIHAPLLNIGNEKILEDNIQILSKTIEKARGYGAKKIVLHTGKLNNEKFYKGIEVAKRVINTNIELLEQYNILLCIENVGYLADELIFNFDQLAAFVDLFPLNLVSVVFDISHANLKGGIESGIKILGNRIQYFHLADNTGEKDNHHQALGKGNIDFNLLNKRIFPDATPAILEISPSPNWQLELLDSRKILHKLNLI